MIYIHIYIIDVMLLALTIVVAITLFYVHDIYNLLDSQINVDTHAPVADEQPDESDYSYDEEVLAKKQAFSERIERIKSELAMEQARTIKTKEYEAQEMHPDVKNLPHNTIANEFKGIPDVEYAD